MEPVWGNLQRVVEPLDKITYSTSYVNLRLQNSRWKYGLSYNK